MATLQPISGRYYQRQAGLVWRGMLLAALLVSVFVGRCASESTPGPYSISHWGHRDGLPSAAIYAIAQTSDGYLWLGTADGLVRFDGLRFQQISLPGGGVFGRVHALLVDDADRLWVGNEGGKLIRLEGGRTGALAQVGLGATIVSICRARDGGLLVRTRDRSIHVDSLTMVATSATSSSACLGAAQPSELSRAGVEPAQIQNFFESTDGSLWIATREEGVYRIGPGAATEHLTTETGLSDNSIWQVFEDSEEDIWVATQNGLDRLRRTRFETFTRRSGLLSARMLAVAAGAEGIYAGSHAGLNRMTAHAAETLSQEAVLNLVAGRDGSLWMSTPAGLFHSTAGKMHAVPLGMKASAITAMAEAADGSLWLYDEQRGLLNWRSGRAALSVGFSLVEHNPVTAMQSDTAGRIWIGLTDGQIVLFEKTGYKVLSEADGLPGGAPHFISADADGSVWIASENGLAHADGHTVTAWSRQDGLPGSRILWAVTGADKKLWLGYNIGVAAVLPKDLERAVVDRSFRVPFRFYDEGDGLRGNPDPHGSASVAVTASGQIWFTSTEGVTAIDSANILTHPHPPQVHITEVVANDRKQPLLEHVLLQPGTRRIEITYIGLAFSDPTKVVFRYRLIPFDTEWHDASTRRIATYTNLAPGDYRFEVLTANGDGVWSPRPGTLNLTLEPTFYQTRTFLTICILCAILTIMLLVRMRVRFAARAIRMRFEERIDERTRVAQDLHDNLLQELMGMSLQLELADELTSSDAPAKPVLARSLQLAGSAVKKGRGSLHRLRVAQHLTPSEFLASLMLVVDSFPVERRQAIRCEIAGKDLLLEATVVEEAVVIAREALRNALQHSAGPIHVQIDCKTRFLVITVRDSGPGIGEDILQSGRPGHYGLAGMRERAARISSTLTVENGSPGGVVVRLTTPAKVAYAERMKMRIGWRSALRWKKPWGTKHMTDHEHRIRVLCVDDHPFVREGLTSIIAMQPDMQVAGAAESGAEALRMFAASAPDVTIVDLRLQDMTGFELIVELLRRRPGARTVVLSSFEGDADIERALSAGAMGYVVKGMVREELLQAIRSVHAGRKHIAAAVAAKLLEHHNADKLTPREIEVLEHVAKGLRNKEIGAALAIAEDTVKMHVKSILMKLGVNDRTEAVTSALRRGIIRLD